jgi:uncharacterized protein
MRPQGNRMRSGKTTRQRDRRAPVAIQRRSPPATKSHSLRPSSVARKKAAKQAFLVRRRLSALKIPPLLLEGDDPPVARPSLPPDLHPESAPSAKPSSSGLEAVPGVLPEDAGPAQPLVTAQSFASPPTPAAPLPTRLFLVPQDARWLHAQWEWSAPHQAGGGQSSAAPSPVLRIYRETAEGEPFQEFHPESAARNLFVRVDRPATTFVAALGYYAPDGNWIARATAGPVTTPFETESTDRAAHLQSIPIDVPLRLIDWEAVPLPVWSEPAVPPTGLPAHGQARSVEPPPPALPSKVEPPLGVKIGTEVLGAAVVGPSPTDVNRAVRTALEPYLVRCQQANSMEAIDLARQGLLAEAAPPGPAGAGPAKPPISELAKLPPAVSSVSAPWSAGPARPDFWFNINAELIIYGATEPDAKVTLAGRDLQLYPDGSFSCRFALPDGVFTLVAEAAAGNGAEQRRVQLSFSRLTQSDGQVGSHPQDSQLQPPPNRLA